MSADGSQVSLSSLGAPVITAYTEEEAIEPTAVPEKKARKKAPRKAKAPPNSEAPPDPKAPRKPKDSPKPKSPPKPKAPKSVYYGSSAAKCSAAKPLPGRSSKKAREE